MHINVCNGTDHPRLCETQAILWCMPCYSHHSNACCSNRKVERPIASLSISGSFTLILSCMHPGLTCFERLSLWLPPPHSVCTGRCAASQARLRRSPVFKQSHWRHVIPLTRCHLQHRHSSGEVVLSKPVASVSGDDGVLSLRRALLTGRSSRDMSRMARSGGDGGDAARLSAAGTCSSCCG